MVRELLRVNSQLVEASLEAMRTGAIVAIQDMGAAGLTSSSFEMAGRGGTGIRLRLDNVSRLPTGVLLMQDALPPALGSSPRFVLDRVQPIAPMVEAFEAQMPLEGLADAVAVGAGFAGPSIVGTGLPRMGARSEYMGRVLPDSMTPLSIEIPAGAG